MDIATPLGPLSAAPKDLTNESVILWVIGFLVVVCGCAVLMLYRLMRAGAEKCEAENQRAWAKSAEKDATILSLHQGVIAQQAQAHADALRLIERNTEVFSDVKTVITGLTSGQYQALHDPSRRRGGG